MFLSPVPEWMLVPYFTILVFAFLDLTQPPPYTGVVRAVPGKGSPKK